MANNTDSAKERSDLGLLYLPCQKTLLGSLKYHHKMKFFTEKKNVKLEKMFKGKRTQKYKCLLSKRIIETAHFDCTF